MRLLLTLLILSIVFAAVTRVEAAEFPEVRWESPAECPDEAAVHKAIALWLSQTMDDIDASAIEVDGRVKSHKNGYLLELSLDSPSGSTSQRLSAARCETLVDAVALYVALAANQGGVVASVKLKDKPTSRKIGLGARLNGGISAEQLPGLAFTATLLGSLEFSLWRVEAGLGYTLPSTAYYLELPDVGVEVQLFYGTARLCARTNVHIAEIPICTGIELGMMRGQGRGVDMRYTSDQFWGAFVLGPALRVQLRSGWWAWLEVEAMIALFRPSFSMRNLDVVYRPQAAAARALLGLEWSFF